MLYKKSQVLFGIDQARRPIGDTHRAVVVEGYTDVMAMHAAGITNTVAACGTAFGEHHLYTLRRMLHDDSPWRAEIVYCFDGDTAGIKAATQALTHVKTTPGRSSVAIVPDNQDPCELRQRNGDEGLHHLLQSRTALVGYVLRAAITEHDIDTVEGRIAAMHHGTALLNGLTDPVTRGEYTRQLARWIGVDPDAALQPNHTDDHDTSAPIRAAPDERARAPGDNRNRWQRTAIQAALQHPALAAQHGFDELPAGVFDHPTYSRLHQAITDIGGAQAAPSDTATWLDTITKQLGTDTAPITEPLPIPGAEPGTYLRAGFTMITAQHLETNVETLRRELDSVSVLDEPDHFHHLIAAIQKTEQRRHELSPASVKGPPVCHEYGTGLCPVAGRVLMVADDRAAGQSERLGWAGLPRRGFCRCR